MDYTGAVSDTDMMIAHEVGKHALRIARLEDRLADNDSLTLTCCSEINSIFDLIHELSLHIVRLEERIGIAEPAD